MAQANGVVVDSVVDTRVDLTQSLGDGSQSQGSATSRSTVTGGNVWGGALSSATAQGNALTGRLYATGAVTLDQDARGPNPASALAELRLDDYAGAAQTHANAAANAVELYSEDALDVTASQRFDGAVDAVADAVTTGETESATTSAIGAGSSLVVTGWDADPIIDADQSATGNVRVRASSRHDHLVHGAVVAAEGAGNTAKTQNDWGYAHLQGVQSNTGEVQVVAELNAADFGWGSGVAGANAVGNNALVSNIGADAYTGMDQTNSGAISATSSVIGAGGSALISSASAFGNAQSAYICSDCPVGLDANVRQTNSGPVTARSHAVSTGHTPVVSSAATAVGNSLTFSNTTPQ